MSPEALAAEAEALIARGGRLLGIAGAPASGKSTLAARLVQAVPGATLLAMDGFHLDDAILQARGDRPRKGAPHTFDVAGFVATLARVRAGGHVYAPVFDRGLELARAAAAEIAPGARLVMVEGNWLLHDAGGWDAVRPYHDACWYLDVAEAELIRRIEARWAHLDPDERAWKRDGNDLPNARLAAQGRARADRVLALHPFD